MNKKLLFLILLYITVIYLTLPVGRYAVNFLYSSVGKENLSIIMNALLLISVTGIVYVFKNRLKKLLILFPVIVLIGFLFITLDRPEERIHFLQYAILGVMFFKFFEFTDSVKRAFLSLFSVVVVGAVDETIQYFLPNRVGDLKDVMINSISGVLGVCIGRLYWFS
ncbi:MULTISPECIES: VanZ family protein [Persephonella]|uniref:Putative membrane protein n=1 Tax=Persephonella marina (strain DSM 14350 / EX-H1) TaxID=123214 RepID=C0QSW6_PERMH|nr:MULTISPECIES: VanZ family protein [Persephonella]ACO04557.1 putative membrane protein [Persephonella marina EX-H1]